MKTLAMIGLPLATVMLLVIASTHPATGQIKKGKTRPLTTSQMMAGLVRPNCASLGNALKEQPADEKAWAALATQAALLNEAGHMLMADGRCPDKTWAEAAKTLRECSSVILEKLDAQDLEGAGTAFQALTKSCASCHKAHRQK